MKCVCVCVCTCVPIDVEFAHIPSCSLQSQVKEKEEVVARLQERLAESSAKGLAAETEVSKVCCEDIHPALSSQQACIILTVHTNCIRLW